MNIENLTEGLILKNYKELCVELEQDIKTGKAKQLQMDDWKRYFNYEKQGHKIIIGEIFDKPLEKIDNRGKSSKYKEMIELLILDLLSQCKTGQVSLSRNKLMLPIKMINDNYGFCGEHVRKLSVYTGIDDKVIYDFYNTSNNNLKSNVETALNSLMDKRVIWYKTITKVAENDTREHRVAMSHEIEMILKFEKEALNEFGYRKMSDIRASRHWKKFKDNVKRRLHTETNIDYYYQAYDIHVELEYLQDERKELLKYLMEDSIREECGNKLNSTIINGIVENAQNRKEKGFTNGKMAKVRSDKNYINNIETLANLLINSSKENFIQHMQNDEGVKISDELEALCDLSTLEPLFG